MCDMQYIQIPKAITYKELSEKFSLSPSSYRTLSFKNKNIKKLGELLSEKPQKGEEVGSFSYINKSNFYFIRNQALQPFYSLPVLNNVECAVPILPMVFKNFKLHKGDILISKDANIGESVYLDEDLPNFMISGGIVRIRFTEDIKYYVFAFLKNEFFKSQIDYLVRSRGATIRHAKTLWLDAVIPFPNQQNKDELTEFVSLLAKATIRKEVEIEKKYRKIMDLIEKELKQNQNAYKFAYNLPSFRDLHKIGRLDAGLYTKEFKKNLFYIENYKNGFFKIDSQKIKSGNTPTKRVFGVGRFIWITPTDFSDYGTLENKSKIHCSKNNINSDCLLMINRTSRGGRGEYVGLSMFYDYEFYGQGQHNQGIYRVFKYSRQQLIFMTIFMNSPIVREICAGMSVGSKMKEIKSNQFLDISFPNFPKEKQEEIAKYYYNPTNYNKDKLNLIDFENEDIRMTVNSGIWQLDKQIKQAKQKLDEILHKIIMDTEVRISFLSYEKHRD
jgi:hypothetical protein